MVEKKQSVDSEPLALRIWGIPIDRAIALLQSVGVPLGFMIFVCYLAWSYLPPVAAAHIELLKRTGDTLERMDETLKQSNSLISEVADVERQTKVFMQQVNDAHNTAQKDITVIKEAVTKDGN